MFYFWKVGTLSRQVCVGDVIRGTYFVLFLVLFGSEGFVHLYFN